MVESGVEGFRIRDTGTPKNLKSLSRSSRPAKPPPHVNPRHPNSLFVLLDRIRECYDSVPRN